MAETFSNRVLAKGENIVRHYFDDSVDTLSDDFNNLSYLGLFVIAGCFVLAFFSMGITNSSDEAVVSIAFVGVGIGGFVVLNILHIIGYIFGTFYKRGIVAPLMETGLFFSILVLGSITFVVATCGGFVISIILYELTPSVGVFAPLKLLFFAFTSVYWLSKGWQIAINMTPPSDAFETELSLINKHTNRHT